MGDVPAPKVPNSAPQALKDFVACKVDDVELDPAQAGWIPKPKNAPDVAPTVTVNPGDTPNSATVHIGFGEYIGLNLPVSVSDGHLHVDTSWVPGTDAVDKWVADLNTFLDSEGKALDGLTLKDGKIKLHKNRIGATDPPKTAALPPPAPTTPKAADPPKTADPPKEEPKSDASKSDASKSDASKSGPGCLLGILIGLVCLIGAGIGVSFVIRGDDGGKVDAGATTPTVTTTTATSSLNVATTASTTTSSAVAAPTTSSTVGPSTTTVLDTACGSYQGSAVTPVDGTAGTAWGDGRLLARCQVPSIGAYPALPDDYPVTLPWFFAPGQQVGINHQESVDDVLTGQTGRSESLFHFLVIPSGAAGTGTIQVGSDCNGNVLTGRSPIVAGDITTVKQPLLQFGPCQVQTVTVTVGDTVSQLPTSLFGNGGTYVVDSNQPAGDIPDPGPWDRVAQYANPASLDDGPPAMSVLTALNGIELQPGCVRFIGLADGPVNLADTGPCADQAMSRLTVWGVPQGPGGLVFVGGALANPAGTSDDSLDTTGVDAWRPLFRESLFPCGLGQVGITVCPAEDAGDPVGAFTVASLQFDAAVPAIDPADDVAPITLTAKDTGHTWTLAPAGGQWELDADGPTAARVILRDSSVTFAVPLAESGAGGFTYSIEPPSGDPVTGDIPLSGVLHTPAVPVAGAGEPTSTSAPPPSAPPTSSAPATATEDLADFMTKLSDSVDAGDGGFAYDRLDPAVIDQFGADACQTKTKVANAGFTMELVSVDQFGPWEWPLPAGAGTVPIDDVQYVTAKITQGGVTSQVTVHLSVIDGEYHWFTYC